MTETRTLTFDEAKALTMEECSAISFQGTEFDVQEGVPIEDYLDAILTGSADGVAFTLEGTHLHISVKSVGTKG